MSTDDEVPIVSTDANTTEASNSPDPQTAPSSNDRNSINSACTACRSKHLKCDGLRTCSRCASQDIPCVYLKSRRGYRASAARGRHFGHVNNAATESATEIPYAPGPVNDSQLLMATVSSSSTSRYDSFFRPMLMSGTQLATKGPSFTIDGQSNQRCLDAFYHYFHGSHPFLPPRNHLLQVFKARPMDHLLIAMCYIGSRYIGGVPTASYAADLELLVLSPQVKDASMVQTMLLYALGLDGGGEQTKAIEVLVKAQRLALEIGMHTREYAIANGQGSPILEESLRRSWHELYVVCIMVAGFHGRKAFYVRDVYPFVPLPCGSKDFENGFIPSLHTLDEFDEEGFVDDEIVWSSYTYRIAAARNLDRIIQSIDIHLPDDPSIHRLEAYLTNWRLHLPESKRSFYDETGTFDEMIFQAHMIADVSSILLHRHYSKLEAVAVQTITSCSDRGDVVSTGDKMHTLRTAQAAAGVTRLVTLPMPLIKHTHFFVCALTLSSIVHLSMWSSLPTISSEHDLKEQIRMNAGALKSIADVWPSARMGFNQVTKAGQLIYATRKDAAGDVFWREFMQEDIMTALIEDDPLCGHFSGSNPSSHS